MNAFFAVIAGALVSFLGVLLTLRWNQNTHEENLRAEREKRKEEREFTAKQNALLSAAKAVTHFINYYITLADRTLPQGGNVDKEISEMGVALNQIHFYCSLETIEKSTHLSQILNEAFSKAIIAKMPSVFIGVEINNLDLQVNGLENSNKIIQEEINSLLSSAPENPLLITLREQLINNYRSIEALHNKKIELIPQQYKETEKCRDVISRNLRTIYEASRDVLLLARKELSFPIDEETYKGIMNEGIVSMEKNLENLYAEIRKQVEEKIQD